MNSSLRGEYSSGTVTSAGARGVTQDSPDMNLTQDGIDLARSLRHLIDVSDFAAASATVRKAEVPHVRDALLWQDARGNTLLHKIIEAEGNRRHTPAADAAQLLAVDLLKRRADANCANKRGETPVHFAAQGGNTDLCQLLLTYGGDLERRRKVDNRLPEEVALHHGHKTIFEFLESTRLQATSNDRASSCSSPAQAHPHTHGAVRLTTNHGGPFLEDAPLGESPQVHREDSAGGSEGSGDNAMYSASLRDLVPEQQTQQQPSARPPVPAAMRLRTGGIMERFKNDEARRHRESQENKWKLDEFRDKNRRLTTELRARRLHALEDVEALERRALITAWETTMDQSAQRAASSLTRIQQEATLFEVQSAYNQSEVALAAVQATNSDLSARVVELEASLQDRGNEVAALSESLCVLRDEFGVLQENNKNVSAAHDALLVNLHAREKEWTDACHERDALTAELQTAKLSIEQLEQKCEQAAATVEDLRISLEVNASTHQTEVKDLNETIERLTAGDAARQDRIAILERELVEARSSVHGQRHPFVGLSESTAPPGANTNIDCQSSPAERADVPNMDLAQLREQCQTISKALLDNQQELERKNALLRNQSEEIAATNAQLSAQLNTSSALTTDLQRAKKDLSEMEHVRQQLEQELTELRLCTMEHNKDAADVDTISTASRLSAQATDAEISSLKKQLDGAKKLLLSDREQASKRFAQSEVQVGLLRRDVNAKSAQIEDLEGKLSSAEARCAQLSEIRSQLEISLGHQAEVEKKYVQLQAKASANLNAAEDQLQLEATVAELRLELSTLKANRQETLAELRLQRSEFAKESALRQQLEGALQELQSSHRVALLRLEDLEQLRSANAIVVGERNESKREADEAAAMFNLLEKDHQYQSERVVKLEQEIYRLSQLHAEETREMKREQLLLDESSMRKDVRLVQLEASMHLQHRVAASITEIAIHAFRRQANATEPRAPPLLSRHTGRRVLDPAATESMTTTSEGSLRSTSSLAVRAVSSLRQGNLPSQLSEGVASTSINAAPHPPLRPSSAVLRRAMEDAELGITHDDSAEELVPPVADNLLCAEGGPTSSNRPFSAQVRPSHHHAVVEVLEPTTHVSFTFERVGPFVYSTSHASVREFYRNQCEIHRVRPIAEVLRSLPADEDLAGTANVRPTDVVAASDETPSSAHSVKVLSVANIRTLCRSSCRALVDLLHVCPRVQTLDLTGTSSSDAAIGYIVQTIETLCGYAAESPYCAGSMDALPAWHPTLSSRCALKELLLDGTLVSDVGLLSSLAKVVSTLTTISVQRCKLLRDSSVPQMEAILIKNCTTPTCTAAPAPAASRVRPTSASTGGGVSLAGSAPALLKGKLEASALHFGRGRRPYSALPNRSGSGMPQS